MKYTILILIALLTVSCSSTQQAADTNVNLNQWIDSGSYTIEANWASPMATSAFLAVANSNILGQGNTAGRINLIGNPNHLKIHNDSIDIHMPFFGERYMGGAYNQNNGGIQFKAPVKDYEVTTRNGFYQIKFSANDNAENYNIILNLYPNENASIAINSNQRAAIRYQGMVTQLKSSEEE